MSTNNEIICLGDGFAHGHIWPEWPQILSALLPDIKITTITGVGAGNEFLINGLLQKELRDRCVIFQWAPAQRFDKMIQDDQWQEIGLQDPIYNFNFYERLGKSWWLSSSSTDPQIRRYHDFYVQKEQADQRLADQKKLVEGYLKWYGCEYVDTSTREQDIYSRQPRFQHIRGNQVQPSPLVHLHFLRDVILPKTNIVIDHERKDRLERAITNHDWVPYDPDRSQIWADMVRSLDTA